MLDCYVKTKKLESIGYHQGKYDKNTNIWEKQLGQNKKSQNNKRIQEESQRIGCITCRNVNKWALSHQKMAKNG